MKKLCLLSAFLLGATLTAFAAEKAVTEQPSGLKEATTATPRYNPDAKKRSAWHRRWDACRQQIARGGVEIVFIGDSITHFWENDAQTDKRKIGGLATYKKYFSNYNVLNLGHAGDRTEHALWMVTGSKLLDGINPKLVVVMIGTNNLSKPRVDSPEAIAAGIEILIKQYGCNVSEIDRVILAGGFGYYINPRDAADIGLLPETFVEKTYAGGNTALSGALWVGEKLIQEKNGNKDIQNRIIDIKKIGNLSTTVINLAKQDDFQEAYVRHMSFLGKKL